MSVVWKSNVTCVTYQWVLSKEILDLRRSMEALIPYGMHSPYVKQVLNSWAGHNRIILQEWKDLQNSILEAGLQLQWQAW